MSLWPIPLGQALKPTGTLDTAPGVMFPAYQKVAARVSPAGTRPGPGHGKQDRLFTRPFTGHHGVRTVMKIEVLALLLVFIPPWIGSSHFRDSSRKGQGLPCTFDPQRPNVPDCLHERRAGKLFVSPKYVRQLNFDEHGLAAIHSEKGWMYVNRTGAVVITGVLPMDNWADTFHDGLVRVMRGERYGFANPEGTLVIPAEYDGAFNFDKGTAIVCKHCRQNCDDEGHCTFRGGDWLRIGVDGRVVARVSSR